MDIHIMFHLSHVIFHIYNLNIDIAIHMGIHIHIIADHYP